MAAGSRNLVSGAGDGQAPVVLGPDRVVGQRPLGVTRAVDDLGGLDVAPARQGDDGVLTPERERRVADDLQPIGRPPVGGALDDLVSIRLYRFVPSFYQEAANASGAFGTGEMGNDTIQSRGNIRFSGYGVMQYQPKLAFIGRLGVTMEDFSTTRTTASDNSGLRSFLRVGLQYSVRKYLDLGLSVGFDDLARSGSFGPAGLLAFRI